MNNPGDKLLAWYDREGRKDIPWRGDPSPYHIWISEIMAQQTRLSVVKDYYLRFIQALPTIEDLAMASEEDLVKLWEGLGYYSRVHNMQKAAQVLLAEYGGQLPSHEADLVRLPGIGPYTAAAIASIAFGEDCLAMDGNGYRVSSRLLREDRPIQQAATQKRLKAYMETLIPKGRAGDFNQAVMDLGSLVCKPKQAACEVCPLAEDCQAAQHGDPLSYPVKKAKGAVPKQRKTLFLVEQGEALLLERRPDQGLLSRMWGLPLEEGWGETKARAAFQDRFPDLKIVSWQSLGSYQHVFSHVIWDVKGYNVRVKEAKGPAAEIRVAESQPDYGPVQAGDLVWLQRDQVDKSVGLATVFRHFVDQLDEGPAANRGPEIGQGPAANQGPEIGHGPAVGQDPAVGHDPARDEASESEQGSGSRP